jgi:hypothetical protein
MTSPAKDKWGSKLPGVVLLFAMVISVDAWLFMLLVQGLHNVWFPRLPTLGYWQAFGIVVPLQWLIRRGAVRFK